MAQPPLKLIYLARRNPKFSHERFIRRWRQHGALAMQQGFFSTLHRYAQCDAIKPPAGMASGAGSSAAWDGIGVCWFREMLPFTREERELTRKDELETFSEYVGYSLLLCRESVLKPGRGLFKASAFIARRPGTTPEAFAEHWQAVHAPMLLKNQALQQHLVGYVQNLVVRGDRMGESRLTFDGVGEFYFHSREQMGRFFAEIAKVEELRRDSDGFLDRGQTLFVFSDEVTLYDAELAAEA
jgi:hypothetical protein